MKDVVMSLDKGSKSESKQLLFFYLLNLHCTLEQALCLPL